MKVHVEFHDDARTKARITLVPGWLARLFGAKTRTGEAARMGYHHEWAWTSTSNYVGNRLVRELELQEVMELPNARTRKMPTPTAARLMCSCPLPSPLPVHAFGKVLPVGWLCDACGGRLTKEPTEAA